MADSNSDDSVQQYLDFSLFYCSACLFALCINGGDFFSVSLSAVYIFTSAGGDE